MRFHLQKRLAQVNLPSRIKKYPSNFQQIEIVLHTNVPWLVGLFNQESWRLVGYLHLRPRDR